jgi:hypothetical protein
MPLTDKVREVCMVDPSFSVEIVAGTAAAG